MILRVIPLVLLTIPLVLSYSRPANFRNRRMLLVQPQHQHLQQQQQQQQQQQSVHHRRHAPFVIRVPYAKIAPTNPLFSHSIAWKAKKVSPKSDNAERTQSQSQSQSQPTPLQQPPEVEVSQFHSQDTNGQVMFGFNAPDQMRIESRNADGTVHGTYSYLDPYGQIIKRQYWDTGAGFHVTSNTYPLNGGGISGNAQAPQLSSQYTPEVQAARDLHFQLYQQALASLLPVQRVQDILQNNSIEASPSTASETTLPPSPATAAEDIVSNETSSSSSSPAEAFAEGPSTEHQQPQPNSDEFNDNSINSLQPNGENGTIVIQNPEYLRISWVTENKHHSLAAGASAGNGTDSSNSKSSANLFNITKFTIQGSK